MKLNEALGMRSVGDVAELSGVTVRTLHHYCAIGLLRPTTRSDAGYRCYDAADIERLHEILHWRELGFALEEVRQLLDDAAHDRLAAARRARRPRRQGAGAPSAGPTVSAIVTAIPEVAAVEAYAGSRELFTALLGWLAGGQAAGLTHAELRSVWLRTAARCCASCCRTTWTSGRPTRPAWRLSPTRTGCRAAPPWSPLTAVSRDRRELALPRGLPPPPGAITLLAAEDGPAVLYIDELSTAGTLLVTSVDPLSHYGGTFLPSAGRFLDRFLPGPSKRWPESAHGQVDRCGTILGTRDHPVANRPLPWSPGVLHAADDRPRLATTTTSSSSGAC